MDDEKIRVFEYLLSLILIVIFFSVTIYCALQNEKYDRSKSISNGLFVQESKAPDRKEDTTNCRKLPVFGKDGNILGYVEK